MADTTQATADTAETPAAAKAPAKRTRTTKAPAKAPESAETAPPAAEDPIVTLGDGRQMRQSEFEARLALLTAPFPQEDVEKLPKQLKKDDRERYQCRPGTPASADGHYCGGYHARSIHLDYVGHAGITMRLNEVDPLWDWEPMHVDLPTWLQPVIASAAERGDLEQVRAITRQYGIPVQRDGGLWIRLTILGITKTGFGDAQGKTGPNAIKELYGDAIRNVAMRFGVGTYLWSKSERAAQLRAYEAPDADLPDVEQVMAELGEAADAADPVAALVAVGNKYGVEPLSRIRATHDGEETTVDQIVRKMIAHAEEVAREQARARQQEQRAQEGAERARQEEAARAQQAAQEAESARVREEVQQREEARIAAHEHKMSAAERHARAALMSEVVGQAAIIGNSPADHFREILEFCGEAGDTPVENVDTMTLRNMVLRYRPAMIQWMRTPQVSRITEADVYEQWGQQIRMWAELVGENHREQAPAEQPEQ